MFRTTPHRQVVLALALGALVLTSAVAGVAVGQADVSSAETTVSQSGTDAASTTPNETAEDDISATIVYEGDRLRLGLTDEQNVTIRTNADSGTKLNVVFRENGDFVSQYQAVVSENGTATVSLDPELLKPGADVSLTVRHGQRSLTKANGVVALPSVTFADGEHLVLHSAENQTVRLQTNASAGTELTISLRSSKYNLLTSRQITVSEDGTATATFDISDMPRGATFTATVSGTDAEASGLIVGESATIHRDATFPPSETGSNATIRGRVLGTATKLDVRVAPKGDSEAQTRTVTVDDNGTFATDFDLSAVSADTEVTVEVGGVPRSMNAVVVTSEDRAPTVYVFFETPASATIRYPQERVLVHAASNQTVYGTTNLRSGTELTVKAVREERNSPDDFTRTANVTVGENGTFAAELNFTGIEPGTNFSLVVGDGLGREDGRVVNESMTLPAVETTQAETSTSSPDVPGFGIPIALGTLVALVAGFALARRS